MSGRISSALLEMAKQLRGEGYSYAQIGEKLGKAPNTICTWLVGRNSNPIKRAPADLPRVKQEAEILMHSVPEDTRPLSARLCGDPLPGRSALDRRAR